MIKKNLYLFFISILILTVFVVYFNSSIQAKNNGDLYSEAIEQIDALIQDEMKRNNIQGLSVALVNEEGIFWAKGYGLEDVENNKKATPQTLYRIASVTKSFTATAIMILVDRGLVDLDTSIHEYIPEFSINSIYDQTRPITVRDLLNHHSGLKRDHYKGTRSTKPPTLDFLVAELKDDYLALPTDTMYKYSNIGYALLGKIIENVSGKSYNQFMNDEIFQPLGMTNSYTYLNANNAPFISKAYQIEGFIFKNAIEIQQFRQRDQPAGSIVSSVEDTAKFIQMILNDGKNSIGEQVLSKESLEQMFVVQYPENELDDDPYGLGWKINKVHLPYTDLNIRHGGTLIGFSTLVAAAPNEKLGIAIFYNTNQIFSRHYIANEALELLAKVKKGDKEIENEPEKERIIALHSDQYEQYVGRYVGIGDLPLVMDLQTKKGQLKLKLLGQELSLKPVSDKRFKVVKEILFVKIGVGQFMGVDDTYFDFYQGKDGTLYPRLILKYKDMEMKILFEKIQPYDLLQSIVQLEGEYFPTKESLPYIYGDSFSEFKLKIQDGWIVMETKWEGTDLEFLLKPINETQMIAYGSGEMIIVKDNKIHYSGLVFEKK